MTETGDARTERAPSVTVRLDAIAVVVVLVGVALRLWAVDHARFTGDESYFWATARNVATLSATPLYGPPLTGSEANHPGPIFYYLMALPQRLGTSPWIGGAFVALLHGVAAWLLFVTIRELASARAALVATVLWCFAPWDVLYADRIWLSCVAPVWGTATIFAAWRAHRSAAWLGAFVFFALVCPQLHMSAPVVWAVSAVLLWARPPARWAWKVIALGVLFAVIAYAPAIYGELTRGFSNTTAILTKGTGKLDATGRLLAPLRVFGYAILSGTSEIGYHFARGYWTPFDDVAAYGTLAGWRRAWAQHGALWASANVVSIALALVAWIFALVRLVRAMIGARARGGLRAALGADVLTLGLVAGLVAATVLMVAAKKEYFPHYTNLLMPFLVWPVALLVDRALDGRVGRVVALVATAIGVVAMASSSIRYYRTIDTLNGLAVTEAMVERVLQEPGRIGVTFEHFHNAYAWQMLATTKHGRNLELHGDAPVIFRVRNGRLHQGPVPPGAELFGGVLLERTERRR
ncbi:hypothetical protein L6R52_32905 [Myxococcota bacterium]|nr:hypothetical protein [Myxococcota bacterium]